MKLARNVVSSAILCLCVGLAGGCGPKKPPGTNPPGESGGDGGGGSATDGGGGSDGGGSDGGGGAVTDGGGSDGGGNGAPADCGAKVSETPTLLFGDKVIMRPPPGVEFIQDDNPTFVHQYYDIRSMPGHPSGCSTSIYSETVSQTVFSFSFTPGSCNQKVNLYCTLLN